jgi:hypothetical protein
MSRSVVSDEFQTEGPKTVGELLPESLGVLRIQFDVIEGLSRHLIVECIVIRVVCTSICRIHDLGLIKHGEVGIRKFLFETRKPEHVPGNNLLVTLDYRSHLVFFFVHMPAIVRQSGNHWQAEIKTGSLTNGVQNGYPPMFP